MALRAIKEEAGDWSPESAHRLHRKLLARDRPDKRSVARVRKRDPPAGRGVVAESAVNRAIFRKKFLIPRGIQSLWPNL
ncbi:hypothetical protein PGTUg99_026354 [Puccinia graminis f. sp. tritici]|uniref:Uncharacterized protein n=1 Tax=Puccinia graminis f. sp. tritici TaxID=56615 RepID=A0A5B0QT21_PUCGR|nr:hypothetical protein PGTUg99_026354 [Puccinia graminis f. sp. tritici]